MLSSFLEIAIPFLSVLPAIWWLLLSLQSLRQCPLMLLCFWDTCYLWREFSCPLFVLLWLHCLVFVLSREFWVLFSLILWVFVLLTLAMDFHWPHDIFSLMFFFRLVFFSPLFSNLNAIVTFVDLINIYPLCDNIFVSTYVMCDLSLKIHPLNFGNAYLECFASEPCFQHYSGWSFLSFLLLLHFIPVALCPMSFSPAPNHLWSLWHPDNFCWTFDFFVSIEIILIFYSRSHWFIFWWLVLLLFERFFFSTSSAPSSLNDE